MCTKILTYDQEIRLSYHKIKDHFIKSTELYVAYLLAITNDYPAAGEALNQHKIKEKFTIDFDLDERIYIRLKLQ